MNRVAITIPTLNRYSFLRRALNFYSAIRFTGRIYIADSSTNVEKLEYPNLHITHIHYPKSECINEITALKRILELVEEPYCCFSGDDDFILVQNLPLLADFLDNNKDFTVASGIQCRFSIKTKDEVNGKMHFDGYVVPPDWSYENPLDRFCGYMRHGASTNYHLHRLDTMKQTMGYAEVLTLPAVGTEILMGCLAALSGRFKSFNVVTSLQQSETRATIFPRVKTKYNQVPTFFTIMVDQNWPSQFALFKEIVVGRMIELGTHKELALKVFHREFINRVILLLKEQHRQNYSDEFDSHLRNYIEYQNLVTGSYSIQQDFINSLFQFLENIPS